MVFSVEGFTEATSNFSWLCAATISGGASARNSGSRPMRVAKFSIPVKYTRRVEFPLRFGAPRAMNHRVWQTPPDTGSSAKASTRVGAGTWAEVECRWDRATDDWRVMILGTNAYGRISLLDIALAAKRCDRRRRGAARETGVGDTGGLSMAPPNGWGTRWHASHTACATW